MAVDSTTAFRNVSEQKPIPLPPGELVTTPGLADQLQITDAEALKPGNLIPFLASQSVRYNEIVNRPEIKTLEGDIPEYLFDDRAPMVSALSKDEQSALGDWRSEVKTMLSSQSGSGASDDLAKEIEKFIGEAAKNNPDALAKDHALGAVDVFDDMLTNKLELETEDSKRKFQELLAAAKDPESVILAMTWRQSNITARKMAKAFEALRFQQAGMDRLDAELALKGKNLTQADMMKANIDFSRYAADSGQINHYIQNGFAEYERHFTFGQSMSRKIDESHRTVIQNFRT